LGDIQGAAVRTLVVSLGDQLAEREPHTAITFLAESPALLRRMPSPDWSRRILQYGLLVAERDPQAAVEYVRRCPEIVTLFDEVTTVAKFEEWFKGGMEVLEYSPEGARAYYALETKKALASVEHAMSGVPLRQVARSLKLFVQGLCGVDVSIESLPELKQPSDAGGTGLARATVSQDGRTIALPAIARAELADPTRPPAHRATARVPDTEQESGLKLTSILISPSRRLALGPAIETVAYCSVTLVRRTSSSGHSVCSHSSRWPRTEAALPVVVVIRKCCSPSRVVTPSSMTMPSSPSIRP